MTDRVVSFRINPDLYDKMKRAADSEGITVSQYVKRAVRWALILRGVKV